MDLESLVSLAASNGSSDLHLEAGLPAALRVRGTLRTTGEPLPGTLLLEMARKVIGEEEWPRFLEQRSYDCSRNFQGVRCRLNILQTARGVGFAIRLLASFTASVEKLNLHPDLKKLVAASHGLILVSGATGSGKSSTMAALIEEINQTDTRHIVTIESPIEYNFRPRRAYIRQREVGRDTPSFEQALIDSLREDPDVLMVGEMREPETMRLDVGRLRDRPFGNGDRAFLDLRRGAATSGICFPRRNPKQRRRPARRLYPGRHLPTAAVSARAEHPRA